LQSGNNKTLKAMRRRYQRELYQEKVEKIKSLLPNACIGVDVIVGFPGETDEDFLDTYNFIQSLDISYLHVFTYSERDNTHAAELQEIVSTQKRAERSKMLHILSEKKKRYFYQKQIGKTLNVLWEAERDGDFMYGFTENYVKVSTPYNETLVNTIQPFTLNEINESGIVVGKMIESATFALLN
jgi:threonylcarbamoyladenosine tRNA methylthiotransferase MtaB